GGAAPRGGGGARFGDGPVRRPRLLLPAHLLPSRRHDRGAGGPPRPRLGGPAPPRPRGGLRAPGCGLTPATGSVCGRFPHTVPRPSVLDVVQNTPHPGERCGRTRCSPRPRRGRTHDTQATAAGPVEPRRGAPRT